MAATNVIACDVRVLNGSTLILGQRGADMTYDADMADLTVTPAAGTRGVKAVAPTLTGWSISLKGTAYAGGSGGFGTLLGLCRAGTSMTAKVEMNYVTSAATEYYTGTAYIKSVKLTGSNLAGEATYDLELQGTGDLVPTVPA